MKQVLVLLAATLTPFLVHAAPAKPNVVIMLVDDMGIMDTSVPFLTDDAGKPKRYPLNDYY
ncbi:MAG: N-acetylgalactosamine-6-sulfatase, partial [Verrucomicrobia bacterium]|nr:N-acetylgalactosamine-6-sulfatase [Verrucomicrobiota bacterium]